VKFAELVAEALGWLIIAVLRTEFGAEISDEEAKAEVRKLRESVRSAVEQGRYDQILPAKLCEAEIGEVIALR
jgi:hypothetical protein